MNKTLTQRDLKHSGVSPSAVRGGFCHVGAGEGLGPPRPAPRSATVLPVGSGVVDFSVAGGEQVNVTNTGAKKP